MSSYVQANFVTAKVRVALIIEGVKIKPVWFEEADMLLSNDQMSC